MRILRAHTERFGVAPDGRLFRNQAGNYVDAAAYGTTWARARKYVLTRTELASGLAKRPYDLRHAGISFWLYSGVDPAECTRRAGQSIEGLFRHYAKFLDGVREQANRLIEQSMQEWDGGGRNWELRRKSGPPLGGPSGRRLTGKSAGQAPFFVPLEEAELLR